MDTTELYTRFRADVFDAREPYLWSDTEVFQYMDAAYKQFVRLQGGIADASSDVTQIPISTGDPWVSLSPLLLSIRRASLLSNGRTVAIVNHADLDSYVGSYDYGVPKPPRIDGTPGEVRFMVTDMEQDRARLINVPLVDDTLQLIVYRLPLKRLTGKGAQIAEVHEQHHEYLLKWMKHLAYSKQDTEARNDKLAERFGAEFTRYCEQARQERTRREHKVRVVAYGGL